MNTFVRHHRKVIVLQTHGVVFENASAPILKTTSSLISILSGFHPTCRGLVMFRDMLNPKVLLINKRFQAAGHKIAEFYGQYSRRHSIGLGRRFDHYDDKFGVISLGAHLPDSLCGGFHPAVEDRAEDIVDRAVG